MSIVSNPPQPGHAFIPAKRQGRPRLGFLGLGWIGRQRMQAIARSNLAGITAIADPLPGSLLEAARIAPDAVQAGSLAELLDMGVDGIVIATPNALHAEQAIAALESGAAVFCQKPLGRNLEETRCIITAARKADRLLGVDLSYRFISQAKAIRDLVRQGELGEVFAAELLFHNAY